MRVLHAIHDFLPRHRAGSEIYAAQLCKALRPRHEVQVLCAEYDPARRHGSLTVRIHDGLLVNEVVNNWAAPFDRSWADSALQPPIEQVLDEVRPDVLHVHNLLNLSFDLPALAKKRGIRVVATLHDHTLVCASGGQRLHRAEDYVCDRIDTVRCARCFRESPFHTQMAAQAGGPLAPALVSGGRTLLRLAPAQAALRIFAGNSVTPAAIEARLMAARAVFESVDRFVAPSRALGEMFVELGLPPSKLTISDYGFAALAHQGRVPRGGPLRIGFVGTLAQHKGAHVLLEACRLLPADAYRLLIFGSLETFPDYVAELRRAAHGLPAEFRGGFDGAGAAAAYRELDVLVVSSLWPENSPLVIHEAFQAGVPVVGARMGGIPDLLAQGDLGPLYQARSAPALAQVLREFIAQPERLTELAARLPRVKSLDEDAGEWEQRYQQALDARPA